ncbi:uncharacterized protein B0I36DRAFT_334166 [Microdochium trichocladiopsis]|uniref:Uncharacterized protein n=1 Tax=Microdochium trichocladiopsis TaxID=1682393 RepID=A0A9P8XW70_9PEZI|nr:uncharacterized protein B0I36DRAFT_334166 [Microdochium trichocladiopsis]KAH7021274.1 hypothetical protein B0I36DRAFT_334166 [Microdochium trichocladiopsis]
MACFQGTRTFALPYTHRAQYKHPSTHAITATTPRCIMTTHHSKAPTSLNLMLA